MQLRNFQAGLHAQGRIQVGQGFIEQEHIHFNGRVLTVRAQDLQALAAILGTNVEGAAPRLDALGLSYQP